MTSSWFLLSTLNYDARSATHQIYKQFLFPLSVCLSVCQFPSTTPTPLCRQFLTNLHIRRPKHSCCLHITYVITCTAVCTVPALQQWRHCHRHFSSLFVKFIITLTPNDPYSGRTAPLTCKHCILYIYSTNINTEYFKHGTYPPYFPLQKQFVS